MDTLIKVGESLIQHGPESDRIYLMKLDETDLHHMPVTLLAMARQKGYGKVFCKMPHIMANPFIEHGYQIEAEVPHLYSGLDKGVFISNFVEPSRKNRPEAETRTMKEVLALALDKPESGVEPQLPAQWHTAELGPDQCDELAALYKTVFASYPFPIFDPAYLRETLRSHILYYGVFKEGKLVAASSAEKDDKACNAEMTDFATHPEARGHGLALHLLLHMEKALKLTPMKTLYTIARALSPGMNITFSRAGYKFGGTLIANTQISGKIESMNVWYKSLNS